MKSILTKKVLIIVSIVSFIAIGAVVLAFATGNVDYPELSNPDGIFYERLDDNGNVIYSITNQELFEEIKGNDGINQLLYMTDSILLESYFDGITQSEIDDKILVLKYGTSDAEELAELTDETRETLDESFDQSMILAGFQDDVESYAKLIIAREKFVMEYAVENNVVTDYEVLRYYLNSYYTDVDAIKIRFTSDKDAEFVMQKFQLVSLAGIELRLYNGYVFEDETLLDLDEEIVEAYTTIDTYYFDEDDNILDVNEDIIYTKGANSIYTDSEDNEYRLLENGNLIDGLTEVIITSDLIFDTLEDAQAHKEANTEYFTVTRTDPYDMDETINVLNSDEEVKYTIDPDGHIFDETSTDVTYTTDLIVNKVYTAIEDMGIVSSNNSSELTDEEILEYYILMYNYVYGVYRDTLPEGSSVADLIALDNEDLQFNYDEENEVNAEFTDYLFNDLSIADEERFSQSPERLSVTGSDFYYMVYKLSETEKNDVMDTIFGYVEPLIVIPSQIGDNIELPTETYYNGTITWTSDNADVLTNAGVVTAPENDTEVELEFTLRILGETETFTRTVTVLADGETEVVTAPEWTEVALKEILDDDTAYDEIEEKLLDAYVYGDDAATTIDQILMETRSDLGFKIYDYYVALDYRAQDSTFLSTKKGDKVLFASFEKTLDGEDPLEITADEFFEFALTKNAALYTLFASQTKEIIYSTYFEEIFGEETDLRKNKSDRMDEMFTSIDNAKSYYVYIQNLYAQYGSDLGYSSFADYGYVTYGTKTEYELLEYFVVAELQPYLIDETAELYEIVEALYPTVQEYYDNYFSLNVSHVLIHFDFDEDGSPDDYNEFKDSLSGQDLTDFEALEAQLETAIDVYEGTFAELIEEYNDASREDDTWGVFKQNGFLVMTEDLNAVDADDQTITHSRTYAGEYGVKDTYVEEFTDKLIELYQIYQLPQNLDKDALTDTVITEFGIHLIEVTQGDDFDKPSAAFEEEDASNPAYSIGVENDEYMPTLEQMQLFAQYKFYSMVYNLTNADVEEMYNITVPNIPVEVNDALEAYFEDLLSSVYVIGTINVNLADRLSDGNFLGNSYTDYTNADLMAMLDDVRAVYFDAIFGDYITE